MNNPPQRPFNPVSDNNLAALIERVPIDPAQRPWLLARLRELQLADEMRALALFGVAEFVLASGGEEAHARYKSLHDALAIGSMFSVIPFRSVMLLLVHASALSLPHQPIIEGFERFFFQLVSASRHHPLIQINLRAVNDIWSFIQLQAQAFQNWQRFGEVDVERVHERSALIHFNRQYTTLMMPMQTGALRGFLSLFDLDGAVSAEAHDAHNFTIEMRW
jgi:hypothetical protein